MNPAKRKINLAYRRAIELDFDDSSRFILFSDCHRGDNSWADSFAHNSNVFDYALKQYLEDDFTYIELGDGTELWKNKFSKTCEAHSEIFETMKAFYNKGRLYILYGNHDFSWRIHSQVEKDLHTVYDNKEECHKGLFEGLRVHESIILRHRDSGKEIFLVHGHQAHLRPWWLDRILVKVFAKPLQLVGIKDPTSPAKNNYTRNRVEKRLVRWTRKNDKMMIAGHTHRPVFPKVGTPPYFNDGSCVHPRSITGIEIQGGKIALVQWEITSNDNGQLKIGKEYMNGPEKLDNYLDWRQCHSKTS